MPQSNTKTSTQAVDVYEIQPVGHIPVHGTVHASRYKAVGNDWYWKRPAQQRFNATLLIGGSMTVHCAGRKEKLTEGDIIFSPPDVLAEWEKTSRGNLIFQGCSFDMNPAAFHRTWRSDMLAQFRADLEDTELTGWKDRLLIPAYWRHRPFPIRIKRFVRLMEIEREQPPGFMVEMYALLWGLLLDISRHYLAELDGKRRPSNTPVAIASRHAARAIHYINNHTQDPITPSDVSEAVSLNPDYLGRLFRDTTGHTLGEYILGAKITVARARLTVGDRSVKDVAASVGFTDPRYFSRLFKRQVGFSPKEYQIRTMDPTLG